MATYGYLVGSDIDSAKFISPSVLDKIHLTPLRSKFVVAGTKESIFNWMENYKELVCEFQDFNSMPHPRPSNRLNHTTTNTSLDDPIIITFKLYDEKDNNNIFKRLLSPCPSKMRLEIHAINNNESHEPHEPHEPPPSPSSTTSTLVMKAESFNRVRLNKVLDTWKNHISNSEQRARDFEN